MTFPPPPGIIQLEEVHTDFLGEWLCVVVLVEECQEEGVNAFGGEDVGLGLELWVDAALVGLFALEQRQVLFGEEEAEFLAQACVVVAAGGGCGGGGGGEAEGRPQVFAAVTDGWLALFNELAVSGME